MLGEQLGVGGSVIIVIIIMIIILIIISKFKEDNLLSMTAIIPFGPPMNIALSSDEQIKRGGGRV